ALVRFFSPRDNRFVHPALGRPKILFACKAGPPAPSLRPQHSLAPLASLIGVELNCDYYEGQEQELVRHAIAAQDTVLIAWKHNSMHVIANAILGNKTSAPQYWPLARFDLVWVFDRQAGTWTFTQVPQLLLAGDRPDVIA
ncbi:MAG: histidine phosphatase family protein, partial [Methylocella sp.]